MKKLITFGLLIILVHQSEAQFQTNGNSSSLGGGCYQLTPNLGNQHGSVWNVNQINLSLPFDFTFSVFLGCSDGGADGICRLALCRTRICVPRIGPRVWGSLGLGYCRVRGSQYSIVANA